MASRTRIDRRKNFGSIRFLDSNLEPGDWTDSNKTGITLRVRENKRAGGLKKTWRFRNPLTGKVETLGTYPEMSYKQVKERRRVILGKESLVDFVAQQAEAEGGLKLDALFTRYIEYREAQLAAGTCTISANTFAGYRFGVKNLEPVLGRYSADHITPKEVMHGLKKIKDKRGGGAAINAFKTLSALLDWGRNVDHSVEGQLQMFGLKPKHLDHKKKVKKAISESDLRVLMKKCFQVQRPTDRAILIMLSTGLRVDNVISLKLDMLNWERNCAEVRTKDTSNNDEERLFIFPINKFARHIIKQQLKYKQDKRRNAAYRNSPYLFPVTRHDKGSLDREGKKVTEWKHMNRSATRSAIQKYLDETTPDGAYKPDNHTMRRTFRTTLSMLNVDLETKERMIDHTSSNSLVRLYDGWDFYPQKVSASDKVSDYLYQQAMNL